MKNNKLENNNSEELARLIDQVMAGENVETSDKELSDILETLKSVRKTVRPHSPRPEFSAALKQRVLSELPIPKPAFGERFQEVVGKLLGDSSFRSSFFSEPEQTLQRAGFSLSPAEIAALKEMEPENMDEWFGDLDERISKSGLLGGLDLDEPDW